MKILKYYITNYILQILQSFEKNFPFIFSVFMIFAVCLTLYESYKVIKKLNYEIIASNDSLINYRKVQRIQRFKQIIIKFIVCLIIYSLMILMALDYRYDLNIADWISGIGTFGAIGLALFKDYIPAVIKYTGSYDGENHRYYVQAVNYSKTNTSIELVNVFVYDSSNIHNHKKEKLPEFVRRYRMFHPIKGSGSKIIPIFKSKNSQMYKDFINNNKFDSLACTFEDASSYKRKTVKLSSKDVHKFNLYDVK